MLKTNLLTILQIIIIIVLGATNLIIAANDIFSTRICPGHYHYEINNRCYWRSGFAMADWPTARDYCKTEGGDLAIVNDETTNRIVGELITKHPMMISAWLGLIETGMIDHQQIFEWVNGEPLVYTNWGWFQSVNLFSNGNHCGALIVGYSMVWADFKCWETHSYICERPIDIHPICPLGYTADQKTQSCISFMKARKSFDDSREECRKYGGDLVSISHEEKELVIRGMAAHAGMYWTGLKILTQESGLQGQWLDGVPLNLTSDLIGPYFFTFPGECGFLFVINTFPLVIDSTSCILSQPFICERMVVKVYPAFRCPQNYVTTLGGNQELTCIEVKYVYPLSWSQAVNHCDQTPYRFFDFEQNQIDGQLITIHALFDVDKLYWGKHNECKAVNVTSKSFSTESCNVELPYVCQHWGEILVVTDLKDLASKLEQNVSVKWNYNQYQLNTLFYSKFCQSPLQTEIIIVEIPNRPWSNLLYTDEVNQTTGCSNSSVPNECCREVILTNPEFKPNYTEIQIEIAREQFHCICDEGLVDTTPINQATFNLLKNMTTPKNMSAPPNLCPCQCNRTIFDPNPSQEVLAQMIDKIQQELKVQPDTLSSKRNKKKSAIDDRTESKAIGYVGIVMCFIPAFLVVALDALRIFQGK